MKTFNEWLESANSGNIEKLASFMASVNHDLDNFEREVGAIIHSGSEQKQTMWLQFLKQALQELEAVANSPDKHQIEMMFVKSDGEINSISTLVRTLKWVLRDNFDYHF